MANNTFLKQWQLISKSSFTVSILLRSPAAPVFTFGCNDVLSIIMLTEKVTSRKGQTGTPEYQLILWWTQGLT